MADDVIVPFDPPLPPTLPPVELDGFGPPPAAPLLPEEVEHYEWLIGGLLLAACKLVRASECPPAAAEAIDVACDLFADLIARINEQEETR